MELDGKELYRFIKHFENLGRVIEITSFVDFIGSGVVQTPNNKYVFNIYKVEDENITRSIAYSAINEEGEFGLAVHKDLYDKLTSTIPSAISIRTLCLREIIRMVFSHLPNNLPTELDGNYPWLLDRRPEDQIFYYKRSMIDPFNREDTHLFYRCIVANLLKGAVNIREYLIDREASTFVDVKDLAEILTEEVRHTDNIFFQLERNNRAKKLLSDVKDERINMLEYDVEIDLI